LQSASTRRAAKGHAAAILLQIRQDIAVPILRTFRPWLDEQRPKALPKSPMGEVIGYSLEQLNRSGALHGVGHLGHRQQRG
jgi:hypothetical protein